MAGTATKRLEAQVCFNRGTQAWPKTEHRSQRNGDGIGPGHKQGSPGRVGFGTFKMAAVICWLGLHLMRRVGRASSAR